MKVPASTSPSQSAWYSASGAVAPVHRVRLGKRRDLVHPTLEPMLRRWHIVHRLFPPLAPTLAGGRTNNYVRLRATAKSLCVRHLRRALRDRSSTRADRPSTALRKGP